MIQHFLSTEVLKLLTHIPPNVWTLMWVGMYALGALVLLWVLAQVKTITGWAGVIVVLLLVTYGFAYTRGWLHQSINPFDNPLAVIEVHK